MRCLPQLDPVQQIVQVQQMVSRGSPQLAQVHVSRARGHTCPAPVPVAT